MIRVDCWTGEDGSLVRVYERYGFSRVREFTVGLLAGDWPGMLLAMRLTDEEAGPGPSVSVTELVRPARGRTERKQP